MQIRKKLSIFGRQDTASARLPKSLIYQGQRRSHGATVPRKICKRISPCSLKTCAHNAARHCLHPNTALGASARMPVGQHTGQPTENKSIAKLPSTLFVRSVIKPFRTTPSITANTAAMTAISRIGIMEDSEMTTEQLRRETLFQATMACVERMRRSGLLTDAEYEKCREMMLEKYNPPLGKIVSN